VDVAGLVVDVLHGQVPGEPIRRHVAKIRPQADAVAHVEVAADGRIAILQPAVIGNVVAGELGQKRVAQRDVHAAPHPVLAVAAETRLHETACLRRRVLQHHVDGAARRIAPEQRPLRTAQHLDALDVEQREVVGVLPRHVDTVDIGADRRVEGGDGLVVALGSHVVHVRAADARVVAAEKVRHDVDQVEGVLHLQRLQRLVIVCTDRHRHVLNGRLTALGGDDDLLHLGARTRGKQQRNQDGREGCVQARPAPKRFAHGYSPAKKKIEHSVFSGRSGSSLQIRNADDPRLVNPASCLLNFQNNT